MGTQFLSQQLAEARSHDSLDVCLDRGVEPMTMSSPEDDVMEQAEREIILGLAAELEGDQATWLTSYLQGLALRDEAEALDVERSTVLRRRERVLNKLRSKAVEAGVVG